MGAYGQIMIESYVETRKSNCTVIPCYCLGVMDMLWDWEGRCPGLSYTRQNVKAFTSVILTQVKCKKNVFFHLSTFTFQMPRLAMLHAIDMNDLLLCA